MSTPAFKPGDRVRRRLGYDLTLFQPRHVYTVASCAPGKLANLQLVDGPSDMYLLWDSNKFELAEPRAEDNDGYSVEYQGHHPDGSGIQQHSCGGLYPYVLVYRDKKAGPDKHGKYDCGVLVPGAAEPLWFIDMDRAVEAAELFKKARVA